MNGRSKAQSLAMLALMATAPSFGSDNSITFTSKQVYAQSSNKPNKRRSKVKASRKANLKNRR